MIPLAALFLGCFAVLGLVLSVWPLGFESYVSEGGVPGTRRATLYTFSVLSIAASAGLLAWAYRKAAPLAALALVVAAPAIALSAAVPCTQGCPLPPYEESTASDLVHAAGSMAGVGACALAMLALAWQSAGGTRRLSVVALAIGWPLLLGTAISILATGRDVVTGTLERLGLAVCLLWIIAVSAVQKRPAKRIRVGRPSGSQTTR